MTRKEPFSHKVSFPTKHSRHGYLLHTAVVGSKIRPRLALSKLQLVVQRTNFAHSACAVGKMHMDHHCIFLLANHPCAKLAREKHHLRGQIVRNFFCPQKSLGAESGKGPSLIKTWSCTWAQTRLVNLRHSFLATKSICRWPSHACAYYEAHFRHHQRL